MTFSHSVNLNSFADSICNFHNSLISFSLFLFYRLTMRYLEMENRTEILNKRLDMLRELLGVLQQQHENAHAVTVEWIVIWLIIISVVLEVFSILTNVLSYK